MNTRFAYYVFIAGVFLAVFFGAHSAYAATLSLQPSAGTFPVGSTFEVSLYLDTEGEAINAVEAYLQFPADKLQVVSPAADTSLIDLWISQPKYNNRNGTVELRGGIPKGANVSAGLISKLRFRVRSTGSAVIRFADDSRVLLHDGKGTDALSQTYNSVLQLVLPPPAGPQVASFTHPDQMRWYQAKDVVLSWAGDAGVEGYSYVLNEEPIATPDNVSEGLENGVTYRDLPDGKHYFHLKALRGGSWGGVTHFALQVDGTLPAEFPPEIFPSAKTTERQPTISFQTTDNLSGINHYELKIVPLEKHAAEAASPEEDQPFFFEAESPYITNPLELGTYDVIVRAYDNAGNFRDVSKRLHIVTPLFQIIAQEGLEVKGVILVPWLALWLLLGGIAAFFGFVGWLFRKKYLVLDKRRAAKELPHAIRSQLEDLKKYQKKYGNLVVLLALGSFLVFGIGAQPAAAQLAEFAPPLVSSYPRNISNDEIFYIGGVTEFPETEVLIYFQNKQTGALTSEAVFSNKKGEWFYRHDSFFAPGDWRVWTQSRRQDEVSPPSSQEEFSVNTSALRIGATQIGYETMALMVSIALLLVVLASGLYLIVHARRGRRKRKEFQKEIREAEESIRRGFAVLKRDIAAELALIKKADLGKGLSAEQKKQEERLTKDLAWAEQYIGKEVWDIEETEHEN